MSNPDSTVLLGVVDQVEATIWRDALEQEGIHPFVRNRDPLAAAGMPLMFGKFEVFVLGRDEKRARWIIGDGAEPGSGDLEKLPEELPAAHE